MKNQTALKNQANAVLTPYVKQNKGKALALAQAFKPMTELLGQYEADKEQIEREYAAGYTPELAVRAKALRLDYVKVRTATEKIKKDQKADIILAGKAIDGLNNIVKYITTSEEAVLKNIENHEFRILAERVKELQEERLALIAPYVEDVEGLQLGEMAEDVFEGYLALKKNKHEAAEALVKELEAERLAKEKKEAEEREAQRLENIQLKKEAEEREEKAKKEAEARAKEEAKARKAQEAKDKKDQEARAKELAKADAKAKAAKAISDAAIKKEQEAKAKAEAKLKAIKDKEEAEAKKSAQEAKELAKAGDKAKLESLTPGLVDLQLAILNLKLKNSDLQVDLEVKINTLIQKIINETN